MLPPLDSATGYFPPGRYLATLDDLYAQFVAGAAVSSTRRGELWAEWEQHRLLVDTFAGSIDRVWLAGSFITDKANPSDIDAAYLMSAKHYDQLQSEDLEALGELTDTDWCRDQGMRIDAYLIRLPSDVEFWRLTPESLADADRTSFQQMGLYDEIWQRTRNSAPGRDLARVVRRGYVEVQL